MCNLMVFYFFSFWKELLREETLLSYKEEEEKGKINSEEKRIYVSIYADIYRRLDAIYA